MQSRRRFVFMLAGTQGGKTSLGPLWLQREIAACGPGDYLAVAPTFPLMRMKMFPAFMEYVHDTLRLGDWHAGQRAYILSRDGAYRLYGEPTPSRILFASATNPDGLESATARAAWIDEAGQDSFRLESWQAVLRRLSLHQGRVLVGTTLYNLGWLRREVYDRWAAGDPDYDVIQFDSVLNPLFPVEEYERARRSMPAWRFNLFYRGLFAKPAGLIYSAFIDGPPEVGGHVVAPFEIPPSWPRTVGLDFGGVNMAAIWLAFDPARRVYYLYQERLAGQMTTAAHAAEVKAMTAPGRATYWGGSASEGQWRADWSAAGVPVRPPVVTEVESGIDRVTALIQAGKLLVFDSCRGVLSELGSYSRVLDSQGEPTEAIKDKSTYHRLDALRYAALGLGQSRLSGVGVPVAATRGWGH